MSIRDIVASWDINMELKSEFLEWLSRQGYGVEKQPEQGFFDLDKDDLKPKFNLAHIKVLFLLLREQGTSLKFNTQNNFTAYRYVKLLLEWFAAECILPPFIPSILFLAAAIPPSPHRIAKKQVSASIGLLSCLRSRKVCAHCVQRIKKYTHCTCHDSSPLIKSLYSLFTT